MPIAYRYTLWILLKSHWFGTCGLARYSSGNGRTYGGSDADGIWQQSNDILAAIGPSIGQCCYEVDTPCMKKVMALTEIAPDECLQPKGEGKYMLDLWEVNRRVIMHAGVPDENIMVGRVCTCCHSNLLFSHRVMGAKRGGMAAMMALNP